MTENIKVNVIGAGVIGLTFGLLLQRKGYQVKIIAEHFPGDHSINYTSPWAGADWRPNMINIDPRRQNFEINSFPHFWELTSNLDAGIMRAQLQDFIDVSYSENEIWLKNMALDFKILPEDQLPPGVKFGVAYSSFTINVDKYLSWLFKQFIDIGGKHEKKHLDNINEAMEDDVDVVVNCTGIMARSLGGVEDSNVYPTRGQTILVLAPHITKGYNYKGKNEVTYIIPRENGEVILGGTLDENDYTETPDPKIAEAIIERCIKLCPGLTFGKGAEFLKIISHNVGLRPSRIGGIRVEIEMRKNPKGKNFIVCHNYGHHSYGYSSSWGTCFEGLELIEKTLEENLKPKQ